MDDDLKDWAISSQENSYYDEYLSSEDYDDPWQTGYFPECFEGYIH